MNIFRWDLVYRLYERAIQMLCNCIEKYPKGAEIFEVENLQSIDFSFNFFFT